MLIARQATRPRPHHLLVAGDREQQCDVDIDPFRDEALERLHALDGAGNLDHDIRTPHRSPQVTGHLVGALDAVGKIRRHFQAHVAVPPGGALVYRAQHIARPLHLGYHQCFADVPGLDLVVLLEQLANRLVIIGSAGNGLVEDRGIGGDTGHAAVHQTLQSAVN